VPFDIIGTIRTTAVIAVATASFTSPILVKSDALAGISHKLGRDTGAQVEQTEELVAGGYAFQAPDKWGKLGVGSARSSGDSKESLGTVVSGLCPGGSTGAACEDGVQLTFIAYGRAGTKGLPALTAFEKQLDTELAHTFKGFTKGEADMHPSADGSRWLRYEFSYQTAKGRNHQTVGVFRHVDGRGVVVVATGPEAALVKRDAAIEKFLASARELTDEQ